MKKTRGLFRWLFHPLRELRTTLRDPDGWLYEWFSGGSRPSATGLHIGPKNALTLSAYFACVRAIAEDLGKIPLILYRRLSDNRKERARTHPLYRLLHDAPNANMSAMDFESVMYAHAMNWGNGYAEIVRATRTGQVLSLWPLDPGCMSLDYDDNGDLIYIYRSSDRQIVLDQNSVFHLRGLGSNGITGYSIAKLARESIGLGIAQERSGAAFFGNAGRPSGQLVTDATLSKEARAELREEWEKVYGGIDNAHKTAVLAGGLKFEGISISNEDAQWIEARHLTIEEMARWLRVPPHIIGHLLRSTFSNIAVQGIEYVTFCLLSWAVRYEQEVHRKLVPPREKRNLYAEHLFDMLLRGDVKSRSDAYAVAKHNGWLSVNDIREKENLNPIGPEGDVYTVPMNMMNSECLLEMPSNVSTQIGGSSDSDSGEPSDQPKSEITSQEEGARLLGVDKGRLVRCPTNGNGNGRLRYNGGDDQR